MTRISELLKQVKRIHFIGIGGSGMCPLAEILYAQGYELSGSDNNEGDTLNRIKKTPGFLSSFRVRLLYLYTQRRHSYVISNSL